jgi:hypothetical protein
MIKGDFVLACLSALVLEVVADLQKKLLLLLCGPSGQIQHNKISCKNSVLLDKATNITLVQQTSQGRKEGRKGLFSLAIVGFFFVWILLLPLISALETNHFLIFIQFTILYNTPNFEVMLDF